MTAPSPLILEIKGNSLDDGPGIRSVVFFKGCPLDCVWCHNPESKRKTSELSFDPGVCVACDACIEACPERALKRKKKEFINREKCTLCFQCTDVCPSGALSRTGREMTASDILETVTRDKPFYDSSGGGITLSGGEPTLNIDFLSEVAAGAQKKEIHVLLETCGLFSFDSFIEKVYLHLDEIFFDIKIFDEEAHKKYCGASNKIIMENFSRLHEKFLAGGVPILPRTPLVPGITDGAANLAAIADFLKGNNVTNASLLDYNPLWHEKNLKIGVTNRYSKKKEMQDFMDKDAVKTARNIFEKAGIILT